MDGCADLELRSDGRGLVQGAGHTLDEGHARAALAPAHHAPAHIQPQAKLALV